MAKVSKQKVLLRRRFFVLVTACFVIVGTLFVTLGGYWVDIIKKYQEKSNLEKELVELKNKEAALQVDVQKLQDPDYVARYAREKYLYSKDGEFIIRIPEE